MVYVKYAYYILSTIVVATSVIISVIKSIKTGNFKKLSALENYIKELIVMAEGKYGAGKGSFKFDEVVTKSTIYAMQNGIKVSKNEIETCVNDLVKLTNEVNVGEKSEQIPSQAGTDGKFAENTKIDTQDYVNI